MNSSGRRRTARRTADSTFEVTLSAAIAAKGVTLAHLHQRLRERGFPVSMASLSYWRSGRSQPERATSLEAVTALEDLLGLEQGALSDRLGPSRRSGPPAELASVPQVVADQATVVDQALAELGLAGAPTLTNETLHVVVDVDADEHPHVITISGIWRASKDDARSMPLIYVNDGPITVKPDISVKGGHLGRDRSRPSEGLIAREFVLERPLRIGEHVVLEQRTQWLESVADCSYEHYLVQRLRELTIWVRFHPDRVPASARSFSIVDGVEVEHDLDLDGTSSVHLVLRGFGPGSAGVRWAW